MFFRDKTVGTHACVQFAGKHHEEIRHEEVTC